MSKSFRLFEKIYRLNFSFYESLNLNHSPVSDSIEEKFQFVTCQSEKCEDETAFNCSTAETGAKEITIERHGTTGVNLTIPYNQATQWYIDFRFQVTIF